ncbi:MAG: hypothetical protein SGILL_009749, partial [Bacillariaceae sp.]
CGYRNGVFQVLMAQFLLFCGFWFATATMGDCSFIEVASPIVVRQDGAMASRIGLLSYTDMETGQCYYWSDTIVVDGRVIFGDLQIEHYVETVLGREWFPTIALGIATVFVSLMCFFYVTSYCCSTQVRGVRMFTGFFVAIVVVILEGLIFLVLGSDWCKDNQCETSRSAGFAIAAIAAFFLSGSAFFFMSNYPGQAALSKLQEEHHQYVMAGDGEAYPAGAPPSADENLEDEPDEEDPLPGDEDYFDKEESEGIEKSLTAQSNPETVEEEPPVAMAEVVNDPEAAPAEAAAVAAVTAVASPDITKSLNAPKPPSESGD